MSMPSAFTPASHPQAVRARAFVEDLQSRLVRAVEAATSVLGAPTRFTPVQWLRDDGRHGGGARFVAADTAAFDRASANVSQVHYDDLPEKRLSSATALSAIFHPAPPRAPSLHTHLSWTQLRDGPAYWRMMADLNPSHEVAEDVARLETALREAAGVHYEAAAAQGDRYFHIPALGRARGATHFYLEAFATEDAEADIELAGAVGNAVIDSYAAILQERFAASALQPQTQARAQQLAYHTLYVFQVLTLDRGTTSGVLVHDQNDLGIMGSLPSHADLELLRSWRANMPQLQRPLLDGIVAALDGAAADAHGTPVTDDAKLAIVAHMREFYAAHPGALALQASGDVVPPTVANHQGRHS